jgi:hypothetical protein
MARASTGYFKTPADKAIPARGPGFDRSPPHANPIAGPICLEGAERGDTLVVTPEDIEVADYSWIAIGPRRGPLGESTRWPELSGDYTTKIFRHTPGPSGTSRRPAPPTQPTLEQLEDRYVPSAPMQSMGMMMGMSMTSMPSPAAMAAFGQLVTDFQHSLQQVLSSQTPQQFVVNETAMIELVFMDMARLNMALSPMGRTG